jgi:uncharacterized lipoprotein
VGRTAFVQRFERIEQNSMGIGDKMKVKVTEVDNNTRIKLKDDDGETVCYIYYNKNMNVLEIKNANKKPIKYIPLGE